MTRVIQAPARLGHVLTQHHHKRHGQRERQQTQSRTAESSTKSDCTIPPYETGGGGSARDGAAHGTAERRGVSRPARWSRLFASASIKVLQNTDQERSRVLYAWRGGGGRGRDVTDTCARCCKIYLPL